MKEIPLTKGLVAIIDDEDYELLSQDRWQAEKQRGTFRAVRKDSNGNHFKMHRVVLGIGDKKVFVDHINGNALDNRKSNLRVCTNQQNLWNTGKNNKNTSGYKGVSFCKQTGKFRSRLRHNGKEVWLGRFDSLQAASDAYDNEIRRLRGEFAKVNTP